MREGGFEQFKYVFAFLTLIGSLGAMHPDVMKF